MQFNQLDPNGDQANESYLSEMKLCWMKCLVCERLNMEYFNSDWFGSRRFVVWPRFDIDERLRRQSHCSGFGAPKERWAATNEPNPARIVQSSIGGSGSLPSPLLPHRESKSYTFFYLTVVNTFKLKLSSSAFFSEWFRFALKYLFWIC